MGLFVWTTKKDEKIIDYRAQSLGDESQLYIFETQEELFELMRKLFARKIMDGERFYPSYEWLNISA